jgi:hypothetical protein
VLQELPAHRTEYVRVWQDIADWPRRSPLGPRVPSAAEIDVLQHDRDIGLCLLADLGMLEAAVAVFGRAYALDPLYDAGEQLYAAWHDPHVNPEHATFLSTALRWLVQAAPLLERGELVLVPHRLPGSWQPIPTWRMSPLRDARTLIYWADRLDAIVCVADPEVGRLIPQVLRNGELPLRRSPIVLNSSGT